MKGRILCTEDDADTREMLTVLLESFGYEVVCPADSILALELMRGLHFDLCLLDNWMPGLSGLELTQKIREFNKTVPILFYSGAVQETDLQQALDAGAQGYLFKPVEIDGLLHAINRLIDKSKSATAIRCTPAGDVFRPMTEKGVFQSTGEPWEICSLPKG
jgi:CheY-like chemotaxis protein